MCQVFETTSIVGNETKVERHTVECDKKPPGGTVEQCPQYKFTPAGSSRKKKGLPSWSSDNSGDKGTGGGSTATTSG
jgi:hypothetical protein